MKLLIEGDEQLYRAAFACQRTGYIMSTGRGQYKLAPNITKTKIIDFYSKKNKKIDEDYTLESYTVTEPEYIALHTLDSMIITLLSMPNITSGRIFLSPSDHSNFRYSRVNLMGPKGLGYKAGRPSKPVLLPLLRDRLLTKWGAEEAHGYEADDMLGIYQTEDTIAVHIDKDINMIEGEHYNHVTAESYFVPGGLGRLHIINNKVVARGLLCFYFQLLIGDPTDNIPGIPRIGPKTAYNLLKDCKSESDCYKIVYTKYKEHYKEVAAVALAEISDLIWICRRKGQTGSVYLRERGFMVDDDFLDEDILQGNLV